MSDSPPAHPAPTDPDAAKRQRDKVAQLLARAPPLASGSVTQDNGQALGYGVRAAFVPVLAGGVDAQRGEPQAAVFTVAYLADTGPADSGSAGADAARKPAPLRPVCFAFNGGPGSSSI